MKLIAAVDGSAPSLKGALMAAQMAKGLGATLELAYVSLPTRLPPEQYAEAIAQIESAERRHAGELLERARGDVSSFGVETSVRHLTGTPAETIGTLAKGDDVWGVVVGAKGHNAVSRMMLGSVADELVHTCTKPVVVVR